MNKRLQGIVIGAVVSALLFSGVAAAAASRTQDISVTFRDIKIVLDGKEFLAKDSNGKPVEPFIYQGTTYLPIRAVGEACGRDVEWQNDTSTVYIGSGAIATPSPTETPPTPPPDAGSGNAGTDSPPTVGDVVSVAIVYSNRPVDDVTIGIAERAPLRVRIEPVGVGSEIVWTSSNASVFQVVPDNAEGTSAMITGVGVGVATLTASVDGVEADCVIRVVQPWW